MPAYFPLPSNLPRPIDDGTADHLKGMAMPAILLRSMTGRSVNLRARNALRTVIYCYPMTGVPGKSLPSGWDETPGARGCTPQTCGYRDQQPAIKELGAEIFGLSTQTSEYQREMAERLKIPFEILSDAEFRLCDALRLPTFEVEGMRLLKRLTLIVRGGRIEHVFYPVFPPDKDAENVLGWLRAHPLSD
ncbi:MAG: peroxiredoxin [Candidatus Acidiferrales bacterium]